MTAQLRIVRASIEQLDAWMSAQGWSRRGGCRTWFRIANERVFRREVPVHVFAAIRGFDVVGMAGFVGGVDGSPVVIVHPDHQRRGIDTRLLRKLVYHGAPDAVTCSTGGARLCKRVGVPFKRVRG